MVRINDYKISELEDIYINEIKFFQKLFFF